MATVQQNAWNDSCGACCLEAALNEMGVAAHPATTAHAEGTVWPNVWFQANSYSSPNRLARYAINNGRHAVITESLWTHWGQVLNHFRDFIGMHLLSYWHSWRYWIWRRPIGLGINDLNGGAKAIVVMGVYHLGALQGLHYLLLRRNPPLLAAGNVSVMDPGDGNDYVQLFANVISGNIINFNGTQYRYMGLAVLIW